MKTYTFLLAMGLLAVPVLHAQVVYDGATNTLSNVTNIIPGGVTVGTNGSFTLLVLASDCLLTNVGSSEIGRNVTARSNEVRLVSPTARWLMLNPLAVGLNGSFNRLTISNGATVSGSQGNIGNNSASASNNTVLVTGAGSSWNIATDLQVGLLGGSSRLEISDGGFVTDDVAYIGNVSIGNQALVTGANSLWSNRTELTIGSSRGGNQLLVNNGGTVVNTGGFMGRTANGTNNLAVISGTGSLWNNRSNLHVGSSGGRNLLIVSNGATVIASNLFVGFNATSTNNRVLVDGGTLRVTNVAGTGTLDIRRGTNTLNTGLIEVDRLLVTNSQGSFVVISGTLSSKSTTFNNGLALSVGNNDDVGTFILAGNGAHAFAPGGLSIFADSTLTGNGSISGNTLLAGILSPGASIGTLSFGSSPLFLGKTLMEISRNGTVLTNDRVVVTGTLTYGGSLAVTNIGPTAFAAGDRFPLFGGGAYAGSFSSLTLPPLGLGLTWTNKLLVDGSIEVLGLIVQTLPASAAASNTATLNGVVYPGGHNATAWFEHGFTTNYGNVTPPQALGSGVNPTNFSQALTGLFGGVTYHFRAVASNSFGVVIGSDQSFGPFPAFSDIGAGLPGVDGSQVDFFHSSGFAAWGDYDNDGLLDLLLAGRGILQVWRNTGAGFVNSGATQSLPLWGCSAAWGDLDNDGRLDFVVTGREENASGPYAVVRHNTGSGFVDVNTNNNGILLGVHAGAAVLGDYDNDGLPDVLMTGHNGAGAYTEVWRNIGNGGWLSINAGLTPAVNSAAAWGDYDSDGRLDLMLSPAFQGLWRNTASGFTNAVMLAGAANGSVAWGDYDNDGRLDLLLTGGSSHTDGIALVLRNTGNGFTNINAGLPGVYRSTAAWGDYDNDGRLDILLTGTTNINATGGIAQVWRNTGNGFTNLNLDLPGVSRGATIWGDYDNDGRLDFLIAGVDRNIERITQVWRNQTPVSNTPPTAPTGLANTVVGGEIIFSWDAASDAQTPASGLTYNLRIGTTPGGSDVLAPMASATGLRRLPQMGNANGRLFAKFATEPGTLYYWSVQAVDTAFAGGPFAPERSFSMTNVVLLTSIDGTPIGPIVVPGDQNSDGTVSQSELAAVLANLHGNGIVTESDLDLILSHYFPNSPFLQMTNVAGLGGTNVTFALTNNLAGAFSVEYSTNLVDWLFLGPATPRYLFTDTNAPAEPQRHYRLRWP